VGFKKFNYISLEEAHEIIMKATRGKARHEEVSVFQAYNRVLAEGVISDVDIPPLAFLTLMVTLSELKTLRRHLLIILFF